MWSRLPIKVRLTLAFTAGLILAVAGLSAFVYARTGTDLLATTDAGLRSRAELLVAGVRHGESSLAGAAPTLIEGDEVFAQVADSSGRILQSAPSVAASGLLPAPVIGSAASGHRASFHTRKVAGVENVTRILAVPVRTPHRRFVVLVGASLQDRADALTGLARNLAIGGLGATAVICGGAWLALAGALRPVERMRREAAAISASGPGRRPLAGRPGPRRRGRDELSSLAATLDQMLDRIAESVDRERELVDRASHELRTPLAIQRMDLDLARTGPQTVPELSAALRSVSAENAHLTRLTEDLLVLSRARGGSLPVRRVDTSLASLLADADRRCQLRDGAVRVTFRTAAQRARIDPVWFRQAIDNLVDNAVRHTPPGGRVDVFTARQDGTTLLVVEDTGPGFPPAADAPASGPAAQPNGLGLGLAVVRAIAEAHGGRLRAENRPEGGARVTISIPGD